MCMQYGGVTSELLMTSSRYSPQVSIRAHGVNGEMPFAFAGVSKQLKFHWTAGNMNIQSLSSVYVEVGVVTVEMSVVPSFQLCDFNINSADYQIKVHCLLGVFECLLATKIKGTQQSFGLMFPINGQNWCK